jgi:putative membrane protein
LTILFIISALVTVLQEYYGLNVAINTLPASILGVALSILIGFRVNSAYERWWEARRIWGAIINDSRSIARQALSFFTAKDLSINIAEEQRVFVYRQIAFAYALKNHLRRQNNPDEIKPFLLQGEWDVIQSKLHIPNTLLQLHANHLRDCLRKGVIDDFRHMQMDTRLSALTDNLGACERIKNTVFPRQYSYYTTLFIAIYTYTLPFIFVSATGWYTIPFSLLVGFIFFALNTIAGGIENPFENSYNDTPMTSISRNIEINLKEMLGEKSLPQPLQPINGFLY